MHPITFALLQTELAMGFPKFLSRRRSNQEYDDATEESSLNMSVERPEEPYAVERMFNAVFMSASEGDSITEGTSVTQSVAVKTEQPKQPSALANFFNSTSTAVGSALAGAAATAATMAGEVAQDMGEIIMADEDEVAAAQANGGAIPKKEKKSTEKATSNSNLTSAVAVTRSRSSASAKNVKEDGGKVQGKKESSEQPKLTGVIEVKRSRSTASAKKMDKTNAKQPTSSKSKAQGTSAFVINPNKNGKQQKQQKQPTSSGNVVKGSPATLAKLMTKLDKKRKLIKKLEQQIEQAEVEMADTKKSIRALAAKFRGVLDGDSIQDQTRDEIVADAKSDGYQSRDDDVSEVSSLESEVSEAESEWGISELAGFYNSEQLKRLEQVISETMAIETPKIPETV